MAHQRHDRSLLERVLRESAVQVDYLGDTRSFPRLTQQRLLLRLPAYLLDIRGPSGHG
jgi:hypothetical protein